MIPELRLEPALELDRGGLTLLMIARVQVRLQQMIGTLEGVRTGRLPIPKGFSGDILGPLERRVAHFERLERYLIGRYNRE